MKPKLLPRPYPPKGAEGFMGPSSDLKAAGLGCGVKDFGSGVVSWPGC